MRGTPHRGAVVRPALAILFTVTFVQAVFGQSVIATIPVGDKPQNVVVNPVTNRVYVASYYGNSVTVIDGASQTVVNTLAVRAAWDVAVHPGLNRYYVAQDYVEQFTVYNGATDAWLAYGRTPRWTRLIEVNARANQVYVGNIYDNRVRVWDSVSNVELGQIPVSGWIYDFAVDEERGLVYAASGTSGAGTFAGLTVIDPNALTSHDLALGGDPHGVAYNSRTGVIYVANANTTGGGEVVAIDAATLSIVGRRTLDGTMRVAVNERTNRVYVSCFFQKSVVILDGTTLSVIAVVPVGGLTPDGIAVLPDTGLVYVADGLYTNTVTVIQDIAPNTPPTANAGTDARVEAGSSLGAIVRLDGSASDPDGDPLTFAWSAAGITFDDSSSATPTATFPIGRTVVTLTVSDDEGATSLDEVIVDVVDTTAPALGRVIAAPGSLWPPNHQMVAVTVQAAGTDLADPSPAVRIVSVTSNEPVTGLFDGDLGPDWVITGPLTLQLRAERAGAGTGRQYTVTVECRDAAGNAAAAAVTINVAHDRRNR